MKNTVINTKSRIISEMQFIIDFLEQIAGFDGFLDLYLIAVIYSESP